MLLDANILLFAVDASAPQHQRAATWLTAQLNGSRPVGIAWESLTAFLRIATHPRASTSPVSAEQAWRLVDDWLAADPVWVPVATERHATLLGDLVTRHHLTGNLIPDAHLAALAIEHGLLMCSADTDFGRFTELRWLNPLSQP